jgi:hypothetical protein
MPIKTSRRFWETAQARTRDPDDRSVASSHRCGVVVRHCRHLVWRHLVWHHLAWRDLPWRLRDRRHLAWCRRGRSAVALSVSVAFLSLAPAVSVGATPALRPADSSVVRASTGPSFAWSAPQRADPNGSTTAISCTSSRFCMVVDTMGGALEWNGTGWSVPTTVSPGGLTSVACTTATLCVAGDASGDAFVWHGKNWARYGQVDRNGVEISALDCPMLDFCGVGDSDGYAYVWTAKGTSSPVAVEPSVGTGSVASMSCPTKTFCVAVAGAGYAISWNGKQWSKPTFADVSTMSCANSKFCVALTLDAALSVWNGLRWSSPVNLDPNDPNSAPSAVSCASPTFCGAVGYDGSIWNGHGWSSPTAIADFEGLSALSCPSNGFCMAIDKDGNAVVGRFAVK